MTNTKLATVLAVLTITATAQAQTLFTYGGGTSDGDHGTITAVAVRGFLGDKPGAELTITSTKDNVSYTCVVTFTDQAAALGAVELMRASTGGSFGCSGKLEGSATVKTVTTNNWTIKP